MISKLGIGVGAAVAVVVGAAAAITTSLSPPATDEASITPVTPPPLSRTSCPAVSHPPNIYYVMVSECGDNVRSVSARVDVPNPPPKIACNDGQSNGQITLAAPRSGGGNNAIEVSWVVRHNINGGKPYLQVGRTIGDQDKANDYPSPDFVPHPKDNPNRPQPIQGRVLAEPLPVTAPEENIAQLFSVDAANLSKSPVDLEIKYSPTDGGQWQILVDGKMIGYYPDKIFDRDGLRPQRAAWWGEVQPGGNCTGGTPASCTAMGNGKPGEDQNSVRFSNMRTDAGSNSLKQIYVTDPKLYSSDRYANHTGGAEGLIGDGFRYGGPGICEAPKTVVNPAPVMKAPPPAVKPKPKPKQVAPKPTPRPKPQSTHRDDDYDDDDDHGRNQPKDDDDDDHGRNQPKDDDDSGSGCEFGRDDEGNCKPGVG